MATWLQCKSEKGEIICVNMDHAISISDDGNGHTKIAFMGAQNQGVCVTDSPERIRLAVAVLKP